MSDDAVRQAMIEMTKQEIESLEARLRWAQAKLPELEGREAVAPASTVALSPEADLARRDARTLALRSRPVVFDGVHDTASS